VSYRKNKGFDHNKGLEALSYLESTDEVFYSTESSITQDKGGKTAYVRLYRQKLGQDQATRSYVKYPLTEKFDNGVSAILALDEERILVMERGFDRSEGITHIKLFVVRWTKLNASGQLVKKEVVELNQIRDQLPAGFRRFDNLEGMTVAGETPNDITLVLVSDNNFSDNQLTQVIAIRIPKSLFGEISLREPLREATP
jgi:hypothetical protein